LSPKVGKSEKTERKTTFGLSDIGLADYNALGIEADTGLVAKASAV